MYNFFPLINLLVAVPSISVTSIVRSNGSGLSNITCTDCCVEFLAIRYDDFLKDRVVARRWYNIMLIIVSNLHVCIFKGAACAGVGPFI